MPTFVAETCEQIVREQLPNLFRLYLNPYVAQTCFCLDRYVHSAWPKTEETFQTFLANGFDEALSGAIKLARYTRKPGRQADDRPRHRSRQSARPLRVGNGRTREHRVLAGVGVSRTVQATKFRPFGFVVLTTGSTNQHAERVGQLVQQALC